MISTVVEKKIGLKLFEASTVKCHFLHLVFKYLFCIPGNLKIHTKSDVKLENHGDYHIFRITGIHVKFSVGGLKMHMGNLFDGIKALGTLQFLFLFIFVFFMFFILFLYFFCLCILNFAFYFFI